MKTKYARVVVSLPINNIFDYLVPDSLHERLKVGMRVVVPFGKIRLIGYVVGLTDKTEVTDIKEIREIIDEETALSDNLLDLTKWMADYYFSTWGITIKTALPSSLSRIMRKSRRKSEINSEHLSRSTESIAVEGPQKNSLPLTLTNAQENILTDIKESIEDSRFRVFLLHGVAGSGKTEIYIEAISRLQNKGAIVLVPEISLTPQLLMRFRSRFDGRVAVLHSGLSENERLDEWRKIYKGEAIVAIGVRSAIFAPFKKLGLIIVDEEQDVSYKQEEGLRYNVRDAAIMRGKIEGVPVLLGSAVPSLESFYNAQKGKYHYLSLSERFDQRPLPAISLIDMGEEKKRILSERLKHSISERLKRNERVLLLLNRRGYSPFLLCRECGYSPRCPNCSITLTYHKVTGKGKDTAGPLFKCHYCNYRVPPFEICPDCGGTNIGCIGTGTERVEEEIKKLYPDAHIARIDRDTISRKASRSNILEEVPNGDADIILGTQIIAKGNLMPSVTLAGVIWADRELNIPDFRSGEKTFQHIAQLAARIGTKKIPGEIIIQTHNPDHYSLRYVRDHDYQGFYRDELKLRKELRYPPFYRLVRVLIKSKKEEELLRIIPAIKGILKELTPKNLYPLSRHHGQSDSGLEILGPAPAPLYKLRGSYRWHLIIKGKNPALLHKFVSDLNETIKDKKPASIKIEIDMDPIRMV